MVRMLALGLRDRDRGERGASSAISTIVQAREVMTNENLLRLPPRSHLESA